MPTSFRPPLPTLLNAVGGLIFGVLAIGWLPATAARAGLTWERKTVEVPTPMSAVLGRVRPILEARFRFTNDGSAAVSILSVQSSCGCTTAELTKKIYEPGERGEIVVKFDAGERVGPQEKMITLDTSDAPDESTVLRLVTNIPELARIRPAFVFWFRGEAAEPKTITLEAPTAEGGGPATDAPRLTAVRVESSSADMAVECREVAPGRRYELIVHPTQTDRFVVATLSITGRFESPSSPGHDGDGAGERTWKAYAAIKPPPTASR